MVAALIIVDGASEPMRADRPTSLERARTPTLDALAATASLARLRTIPDGLPVGSETAIPALLGWVPAAPVDRARMEAAARDIAVPDGHHAWRVDAVDASGRRAALAETRRLANEVRRVAPHHNVRLIGGHRMLVIGPPPLAIPSTAALRVWPIGAVPPRILDSDTLMVCAVGAAAGAARLMGARIVVPQGATGGIDTDLSAKAAHAVDAIRSGVRRVVVHIGAADEAAHMRDAPAKVAAIEEIDRLLLPPIVAAISQVGGILQVCADHGCDPATGMHDGSPVPALTWTPRPLWRRGDRRLTERAVAQLPVIGQAWSATPVAA